MLRDGNDDRCCRCGADGQSGGTALDQGLIFIRHPFSPPRWGKAIYPFRHRFYKLSKTKIANEGRRPMRARLTGFAVALFASVATAGIAGAQSSYPCTQTNDNLPNPYRLVANWASPPRPWMPV